MSCDNEAVDGFGPLLPGLLKVEYGNADALESLFESKSKIREKLSHSSPRNYLLYGMDIMNHLCCLQYGHNC